MWEALLKVLDVHRGCCIDPCSTKKTKKLLFCIQLGLFGTSSVLVPVVLIFNQCLNFNTTSGICSLFRFSRLVFPIGFVHYLRGMLNWSHRDCFF